MAPAKRTGCSAIAVKALVAGSAIIVLFYFVILPLIGLVTGDLLMLGRGDAGVVHGLWARIISAAILAVAALILVLIRIWSRRRNARPKILFPPPDK